MNPLFFPCSVCNKKEIVQGSYCKDCLKAVTIDLMHVIDQEQLEGTEEQQKHAWNLYVEQYSDLKERFIKK
jgi:predicted amidophosphoribosyltransferase